jgi:cobalt-zinc-cadmium efflux system outer membrane protein
MKVLICLMTMLWSLQGLSATTADTQRPVTLQETIERVLEHNPALQGARYRASAAEARTRAAVLPTPLSMKLELENFAGSGDAQGTDIREATLSLARVLELGDKPRLRGELARQNAELLRNEQDSERLDLLAETAERFLAVVTNQERLAIAREATTLANDNQSVVERRFRAGRTPAAERSHAIIEVARAEIEQEHAEHQLAVSRLRLAAAWGQTQTHFSSAAGDLFDLDEVADFDKLENLLEQNPDLVRLATAKRLAEARTRLAQADRRPDIDVTGGLRYLNDSEDVALVLSASMPFGSRSRAAPAIEESEMLGLAEPLAFEQRRLELYTTLFEIHQELLHSHTAVDMLRRRIIPEAERARRDFEKGYALGRYSFLELLSAQRTLLGARLEAVQLAADYHRYQTQIDRLTGGGLMTGGTP